MKANRIAPLLSLGIVVCGCVGERTNPIYCDGETPCSSGQICDYKFRRCIEGSNADASMNEDMSMVVVDNDLSMTTCPSDAGTGVAAGQSCVKDSDCQSLVCDQKTCVDSSRIVYVNNFNGDTSKCNPTGSATMNACGTVPFCYLSDGTHSALRDTKRFVAVIGSTANYEGTFFPVADEAETLTIVGPGRDASPPATVANSQPVEDKDFAFAVFGASTGIVDITVRGLVVAGGFECFAESKLAPSLQLFGNKITAANSMGIAATDCNLTMDANWVGPGDSNQGVALSVERGTFNITNNMFVGMQALQLPYALAISDASGHFSFNTVAGLSARPGSYNGVVYCQTDGGVHIENSIIAGNVVPDGGMSQFGGDCVVQNTVTGPETVSGAVATAPPDFTDPASNDYSLKDTATSRACCIDHATPSLSPTEPDHDYFGTMRPQGSGWDVGADEVKQ